MDYDSIRGSPLHIRASLTAAGSVELFSSASGTRWHLFDFFVGWVDCTITNVITFMEQSTTIMKFACQTTAGTARFDLKMPYPASSSNTSLRMNTSAGGTITGIFVGVRTGSDV